MRVNICLKRGWILERLGRELEKGIRGVIINCGQKERATDANADMNYYMPAKDVLKFPPPPGVPAVGLFTHGEPTDEIRARLDMATAMNEHMGARLSELGLRDVSVICPGTEPPRRAPIFGVVGRPYRNGRKGEELVGEALRAGFRFVACCPKEKIRATNGTKWPCKVTHTTDQREAFYRVINYLVVTSLEEGGPMPVLEAIARHVPVIAPDVGFCWEQPVIRYERGSWESLRDVLERLARPPSWKGWVEGHRRLFARLLREKAA